MTPNYNRPVGSTNQAYSPQYSPASGASPRYNATSSHHQSAMPSPGAARYIGGSSSMHHQGTPVSPGASGAYIPSSPMYNANAPGTGMPSYIGGGSPIEDSSQSEYEGTPNQNTSSNKKPQ